MDGPFSVSNDIPLIPQTDKSLCWAACIAMMKGTSIVSVVNKTPHDQFNLSGIFNYSDEIDDADRYQKTTSFARAHQLQFAIERSWSITSIYEQLLRGPMIFERLDKVKGYDIGLGSGSHWVLVTGIARGANGIEVSYNDPWPPQKGAVKTVDYAKWLEKFPCLQYRVFWSM